MVQQEKQIILKSSKSFANKTKQKLTITFPVYSTLNPVYNFFFLSGEWQQTLQQLFLNLSYGKKNHKTNQTFLYPALNCANRRWSIVILLPTSLKTSLNFWFTAFNWIVFENILEYHYQKTSIPFLLEY